MNTPTQNVLNGLAALSVDELRRKANQQWELAGLARQDRDKAAERMHTANARAYDAEMVRRHDAKATDPEPVKVLRRPEPAPIDMVLHCPACHAQHIDAPTYCTLHDCHLYGKCYAEANGRPEMCDRWDNPPHRSHLCATCGHVWRPADVPTNGVRAVQTRGKKDDPVMERPQNEALALAHLAVVDMQARKDAAYLERNRVVALLAKIYPSGIARTAIEGWSPEWHNCVYIDLPTGQASWHYHDSHAWLFSHLPPYTKPWDGHTTDQKYLRVLLAAKRGEDGLHEEETHL